jgi:hypothetical protein
MINKNKKDNEKSTCDCGCCDYKEILNNLFNKGKDAYKQGKEKYSKLEPKTQSNIKKGVIGSIVALAILKILKNIGKK